MSTRSNIEFKTDDNLILRGWFYQPKVKFSAPCVVMTHGFSALKEHNLDSFATRFCEAGLCVLVYDNRNFGESDALCPYEVDPHAQVLDMINAITFVQGLKNVDPNKIALWGTSFSGGIVIEAAALDKRPACIVAQVPFVSGYHKVLKTKKPDQWEESKKKYALENRMRAQGKPPTMIPVVTQNPNEQAVMKQPEAYHFFTNVHQWKNQVTLHSVELAGDFDPMANIEQINAPLLVIIADKDTVNPAMLSLKAFEKAPEPKQLVMINGDHFAPYLDQFELCVKETLAWFKRYLF